MTKEMPMLRSILALFPYSCTTNSLLKMLGKFSISLPILQIAIGTDDVYRTAEAIKLCGGKITREPGPLPGISTKITACLDPDGWKSVCLWHNLFDDSIY